jgi:Kef-type K+ transport system membrane component KefB
MNEILSLIQSSSFYEFATILVLAAVAGTLGTALRQPLVISFIIVGVLIGPSALGLIKSGDEIVLLAKLGISILLFIVGLKLDLKLIRSLGSIATIIGLGQISFTIIFGAGVSLALGFPIEASFLIGIALAFSSTIIIIKILSDKREIDSLHGRISLGVLIVQDLVVVFSMIVMAALSSVGTGEEQTNLMSALLEVVLYTVLLLAVIGLFMRFAALGVISFMAKHQELLLCFSIAWAVSLAALCDMMGLSKELGGLLAGISLASTPFRESIISRLSSLRDFLLLFFFVSLGTQLDLSILGNSIVAALILSVFVLVFKPLVIMSLCGFLGYRKRTGFLAGISLAQISEFSLIFAAMAYSAGFLTQDVLGLITLVGIVTIIVSTYLISLSQMLFTWAEPVLGIFEKSGSYKEQEDDTALKNKKAYDIILFGLGRYGRAMAEAFKENGKTILAVDLNPEEVRRWRNTGYDAMYGDAHDPDYFHSLPLKRVKWVISALPQHDTGLTHEDPRLVILQSLRDEKFQGKVAVACHQPESAELFKGLGAEKIFLPFHDAAKQAVEMVVEDESNMTA